MRTGGGSGTKVHQSSSLRPLEGAAWAGCGCLCYNGFVVTPKLIFLRGPSGVGKSTVAQALMRQTSRPTVLVDLDYYRFGFVNRREDWDGPEYEMSGSDILIGLRL